MAENIHDVKIDPRNLDILISVTIGFFFEKLLFIYFFSGYFLS